MSTTPPDARPTLGAAYTIERELGGGGMSRVFVATETALKRRVVVKVLGRALAEGLSAERFAREIALAAALQDPHIVPVHATGTTGEGLPFFTMPFVEGESLRARLQRGAVPLDEALRILRDIAEALEYAHARGVVHRDIKPENVLLSGRSAVVADFGIAKALTAARTHTAEHAAAGTLTSVGMSLGTPAYMAPEQAAGDAVDHRTDLYSWGMVAYELLAGAHPFASRASAAQLMAAQLSEMPKPLDAVRPGLPPALGALVMRCLAKAPTERPADAAAVLATLGGATTDLAASTGRRAPVEAPGRGRTLGLAAAVLVLVLAGGAWLMGRSGASTSADTADTAVTSTGTLLAVLPFEHQGDSADAYITEGLSDELRGRLSGVPDLAVIARGSSVQYRGTTKSPREIAEELGVRWLLTATVQVSGTGDTRRVIVRPELVEVGADGQPRTRWGEPFDAEGADALRLQGDIAGRVVDAMQVKLAGADRVRTIAVPTTDPSAYDAYLRGRAATEWGANQRVAALERAIPYFEEAVQRDSTFVDAWLGVAMARVLQVLNGRANDPALVARATEAIERVERLAPESPQALLARSYHARAIARDYEATRVLLERGARLSPGDHRFAGNLGYLLLQNLGRSEEAVTHFTRALALDPNNGQIRYALAQALIAVGRLPDAKLAADRAVALLPGSAGPIYARVIAELGTGDTASARVLLRRLFPTVTDETSAFLLGTTVGWLLDAPAATRLLALDASAVGMGRAEWAVSRAALLRDRGDGAGARAWGDTARLLLASEAAGTGAGSRVLQDLAFAEALAGRANETLETAVRARDALRAERGVAAGSSYADAIGDLAGALAIAGMRDSAIAWLADPALAAVGIRGPRLAVAPEFANLRDDPRFRALAGMPPR